MAYQAYRSSKPKYTVRILFSYIVIGIYCLLLLNPSFGSWAVRKLPLGNKAAIVSPVEGNAVTSIDMSKMLGVKQDLNNITYLVKEGDSIETIAQKYNVAIDAIKKHNDVGDGVSPGDVLFISKSTGIVYELQDDRSLDDFARKYGLSLVSLKTENFFEDDKTRLREGDQIFIPLDSQLAAYSKGLYSCLVAYREGIIDEQRAIQDGCVSLPKPRQRYVPPTPTSSSANTSRRTSTTRQTSRLPTTQISNAYSSASTVVRSWYYNVPHGRWAAGHCTAYAAYKFFGTTAIKPRNGHAKFWLTRARAAGYPTGTQPVVGAIASMPYTNSYYGHVGIVEDIDRAARRILVSDMNYLGRYTVSVRWVSFNRINGYIYHK